MNSNNLDETFKKIEKEYQDIQQIMLLQDIINIYEGKWPNYEVYLTDKNDELEKAKEFNPCILTLRVEPIILEVDKFQFLRVMGAVKRHYGKGNKNEQNNH